MDLDWARIIPGAIGGMIGYIAADQTIGRLFRRRQAKKLLADTREDLTRLHEREQAALAMRRKPR